MIDPVVNPEPVLDAPLDTPATTTWDGGAAAGSKVEDVASRPEVRAGAAFAGGVLLAMIVRRLGR